MDSFIKQANINANGEVAIPSDVLDVLGAKPGDYLSFTVNENQIVLEKSLIRALKTIQDDMAGEAEKSGLQDEHDVQKLLEGI
ncbi:MAG: AbrB/MazE/SpoVT family DNA-binding domain-containing protein [Bacilli bacterium]|nr:AbrB/MazE/SpoVT family DNA-binding domain-containing protein [Bacilli bacterium]